MNIIYFIRSHFVVLPHNLVEHKQFHVVIWQKPHYCQLYCRLILNCSRGSSSVCIPLVKAQVAVSELFQQRPLYDAFRGSVLKEVDERVLQTSVLLQRGLLLGELVQAGVLLVESLEGRDGEHVFMSGLTLQQNMPVCLSYGWISFDCSIGRGEFKQVNTLCLKLFWCRSAQAECKSHIRMPRFNF